MPSELPMPKSKGPIRRPASFLGGDRSNQASSAKKGAATTRRHKEEQRTTRLDEIRHQIADGTLVVRQMTDAEHATALHVASDAHVRNEARRTLTRALHRREA